MCGIGGFSLSEKSSINARKLSNIMLSELDVRGNQASGFGYQTATKQGLYKKDVAGSALSLKSMPKDAKNVILHTRFATHGTIIDMENNHPVQSPDETIDLVHNGVIFNHDVVRKELSYKLPEVDTSVIPAILQKFDSNTDKFNMLDGDASVAWLDKKKIGVMQVARIAHSPLFIAQVKDGSFLFASTAKILQSTIDKMHLKIDFFQEVQERKLYSIKAGRIITVSDLPEMDPKYEDKSFKNYGSYRNMTSGGHGNSKATGMPIKSLWGDVIIPESWYDYDEESEGGYPDVVGLSANQYGEYFDKNGVFMGDYNDMVDWGIIDPSAPEIQEENFYFEEYKIS
jgi:glucosamine 6-phosphate synthetase-like amidotransferase/phosphosugar isomerase protein